MKNRACLFLIASLFLCSGVYTCTTASAAQQSGTAIARLAAEIRKDPANMNLRREIAQAFLKAGLAARAEEQLKVVVSMSQAGPKDLLALADTMRFAGKYSEASGQYAQVLAGDPANADALIGISYCHLLKGENLSAARICKEGLRRVASEPAKRKKLAEALLRIEAASKQDGQGDKLSLAGANG